MEALSSMQSFLKGRPKSFRSLEQAIEWRLAFFGVGVIDYIISFLKCQGRTDAFC